MTDKFDVKHQGPEALPAAVAEARQLLSGTQGFVLLSINDEGVGAVLGCGVLDLLVLSRAFARVAETSLEAMLATVDDIKTKH